MSATILMIEDDVRLAHMVTEYLSKSGFTVIHRETAQMGLDYLRASHTEASHSQLAVPQLVVLDLMLPDMDGLDVCRQIRTQAGALGHIPILMLTAKGDPMDRVIGLELGADDYLPKPFEPRELLARIRAVLRRRQPQAQLGSEAQAPSPTQQDLLRFGSLEIDRNARTVTVAGEAAELTSYQFDLLVAIAERAGRVLTRDQIMEAVRGRELEAFDRSIDVHMGRIRAAIEADIKNPRRILTVRGVGYVFAKQQD